MIQSQAEFVLQWNTRSLISCWGQFKHYVLSNNPLAAAIQETHFKDSDSKKYTFKISGYSLYKHNVNTHTRRRGGTALLISNNLLHHEIELTTPLDAVAVNVKLAHQEIILVSIYFRPQEPIDFESFTSMISAFNTPCLIMGDMNAHHLAWGSNSNTKRGEDMLNFIDQHGLVFLNDKSPTCMTIRQNRISYTAIDLALASPRIASKFNFNVQSDPLFSDHYPIHLELNVPSGQTDFNFFPRWNLNKADWAGFQSHIDVEYPKDTQPDLNLFLNKILASAHQHIPHTAPRSGRRASPWWNSECQKAVALRKRALKQFQRCICQAHEEEARRTRHLAKEIIQKAKLESWQSFASEFNRFTPLSKIWSMLKSFSLKNPPLYKIPHLNVNDIAYSMPVDVAIEFAKHFASISSANQYSSQTRIELNSALLSLNFESDNSEPYNAHLTEKELTIALGKCGKTAVGPDQLDYSFLKNLTEIGLSNLLAALNTMWSEGSYPQNWSTSTLIPFLKLGKPPSKPSSYRPISLTSCACKLFERIISNRLRVYIETNNILSPFQSGFRPGRSTADNIIRIVDSIQCGFQEKEDTVALFLDLKAAFDKVNKSALLIKLHKAGIRGKMAKFIQNFLESRTFQVRCGSAFSPPYSQDHGVPQGSVLSPTLFLIMINDVFQNLPNQSRCLKYSLYADDLVVWATHHSVDSATDMVQNALNSISSWCTRWGLEISASKSVSVTFSQCSVTYEPTPLKLNGEAIPVVKKFKYLGVTLDTRLNFIAHFEDIVQRCSRRLNLMKSMAGRDWGGDRSTLLKMYTSLIRPILDYSAFIFDSISSVKIKSLQIIQNHALRIITGALRVTNTDTLHVETNIPTLFQRRKYQLLRFYVRQNSFPSNPTYDIVNAPYNTRSKRQRLYPRISIRIEQAIEQFDMEIPNSAPTPPLTAYWLDPEPDTYRLFTQNKNSITQTEALALFNKFKAEHNTYTFIYTDGSLQNGRTGFAVYSQNYNYFIRLPDICGIYTAELTAILYALKYIKNKNLKKAVICTDSSSSLLTLKSVGHYRNHLVYNIRELVKHFSVNQCQIKFLWIPSHVGIPGNERADFLAKFSLQGPTITDFQVPLSDLYNYIQKQFHVPRQREWDANRHHHLYQIKPKICHFKTAQQNSREKEVILARLRLGRTSLTDSHIIGRHPAPICHHCQNTRYTIKHFLIECPQYRPARLQIVEYIVREGLVLDLPTLLGDDHPELVELLFAFLHDTRLARSI